MLVTLVIQGRLGIVETEVKVEVGAVSPLMYISIAIIRVILIPQLVMVMPKVI